MSRLVWCLLLAVLCGFWSFREEGTDAPRDGRTAAGTRQWEAPAGAVWRSGDLTITALASYTVEGRVMATARYRFGREASISPVDFMLSWGRMSRPEYYNRIRLSHGRTYHLGWGSEGPPVPHDEVWSSLSNHHLIPATDDVRRKLLSVKKGSIVRLAGTLVSVTDPAGYSWVSSLSRTDTGFGNCELMRVDQVNLLSPGTP